ncbi:ComEC/Rec2 family competence protein [Mariniblastus sp.]|nr:ComEC/Rec2 family competence protein [Mariniblastus sp.]
MDESTLQSEEALSDDENHCGETFGHAERQDSRPALDSELNNVGSAEVSPQLCRQPMLAALLSAIAGILLDYLFAPAAGISLTVAAVSLMLWFGCRVRIIRLVEAQAFTKFGLLLFVGIAAVGAAWHHMYWHRFSNAEIGLAASVDSKPCCVELRLCSEPQFAPAEGIFASEGDDDVKTYFYARAVRIRSKETWQPAVGNTQLVIHADANHLRSGDVVRVSGSLVRPAPPTNPGQYNFSLHYRRQRLLAFVHVYQMESVELLANSDWASSRWLSSLRRRLNEMLWEYVGPEEAPFASAILLGNRRQMKKSSRDKFVETGTAHLLAISGLHIGILAGAFLLLLRSPFFTRRHCLWATIAFVIFYAWLVEFRPPVTRASILIVLFCLGKMIGERGNAINLLSAAALIVLAINPTDLFSIGPQLSFLAVTTLILGHEWIFGVAETDPLKRLIANTRPWPVRLLTSGGRAVKVAVSVSAVIWLVALPLVANRFHVISYASLVVNPLLMPPVSLALYFGMGTLVFGWFLSPAARVFGYACDCNLWLIESIVKSFQAQGWSHGWTAGPSNGSLVCFYSGLLFCLTLKTVGRRGKAVVLFGCAWLVLGWWLPAEFESWRTDDAVTCTFVDVGHGTGVLLQLPDGQNWLYDAGSLGSANFGASNIAGVLWHEHVQHLDTVVISHADVDHFNSLERLAEQFSIGRLLVSNTMLNSNSTQAKNLIRKFESLGIPVCAVSLGDQWQAGRNTKVSVLAPTAQGFEGNDNANSIVLLVDSCGRRLLLPGDLEKDGLDFILSGARIDCDVVMAAHHGSPHSDPQQFMEWSTPEWVVISGGSKRVSEVTGQRFLDPASNRHVLRTDQSGAVKVRLDAAQVTVQRWETDRWVRCD